MDTLLIKEDDYFEEYNIIDPNQDILIYRAIKQKDQNDNGWYILKGSDIGEDKIEELRNNIELDEILCYFGSLKNIDFNSIYISKTTIKYQLENGFNPVTIFDRILYESEKKYIC